MERKAKEQNIKEDELVEIEIKKREKTISEL